MQQPKNVYAIESDNSNGCDQIYAALREQVLQSPPVHGSPSGLRFKDSLLPSSYFSEVFLTDDATIIVEGNGLDVSFHETSQYPIGIDELRVSLHPPTRNISEGIERTVRDCEGKFEKSYSSSNSQP